MKWLANNSYGYQIMDRSQQTITIYLSDKKNIRSYQKQNVLAFEL